MTDIYLITGFLGAGKTTLVKNLIKGFQDTKTAIIVNEFGKEGVDGVLLRSHGMVLEEISNGSIFCVCRSDKFIDALIKVKDLDIENIIVESSGLADPFGMPKILSALDKLAPDIFNYKGSICVVDTLHFTSLYSIAPALKHQVQGADLILLNKVDLACIDKIEGVKKLIYSLNDYAKIIETSFSCIKDFSKIHDLQWYQPDMEGILLKKTIGVSKTVLKFSEVDIKKLISWLKEWVHKTYRIKGFVRYKNNRYYIESIKENIQISESTVDKEYNYLVVLSSNMEELKREIKSSWKEYFNENLSIG